MGVLKDSLITLEDGETKNIEELKHREIILSCNIQGLFSNASNNITLAWSEKNPVITKQNTLITHKWKEKVSNYRIINNKLKISQDGLVLFKNDENIISWVYVKSLRRGDLLFNDKYEFEEIKTIKRIRGDTEIVCLSVYPNQYYFVNGYLTHNSYICDACETCRYWPTILQWHGPHQYNSTSDVIGSNLYGQNLKQNTQATRSIALIAQKYSSSSWGYEHVSYRTAPWSYFPKQLDLRWKWPTQTQTTLSGSNYAYYVTKYWDKYETTTLTGSNNVPANNPSGDPRVNLGPGWKAWIGAKNANQGSTYGDALGAAKQVIADGYGAPHDFWYHGGYSGGGNTTKTVRFLRTGSSGASMWVTTDEGTTWTEVISTPNTSTTTGPAGGYLNLNEYTMGGQGNSKVYVIFKFPLPSTSGSNLYTLRWELLENAALYNFTTHTFTNCGKTGKRGPTLNECKSSYGTSYPAGSSDFWNNSNYFGVTGQSGVNYGIQWWRVPGTGEYDIDVYGAEGGGGINDAGTVIRLGGKGARIKSRFSLTKGDYYWIVVGQKGTTADAAQQGGGGGGGSFVVKVPNNTVDFNTSRNNITSTNLLIVAGGGGGSSRGSTNNPGQGASGCSSVYGNGAGGVAGASYQSGGGGGFISNGAGSSNPVVTGGYSFKGSASQGGDGPAAGQTGGYGSGMDGGFGGGGGARYHAGGGGGGAKGGDGPTPSWSADPAKAGTSYSVNTIDACSSGYQTGHGKVIITAVGEQTTFVGGTGSISGGIDPGGWFAAKAFNH